MDRGNFEYFKFLINFEAQSTFMSNKQEGLQALQDIRNIMERSSRFISLSGWSGIAAGVCALAGGWLVYNKLEQYRILSSGSGGCVDCVAYEIIKIALVVFAAALSLAFLFTWIRSHKDGIQLWGNSSKRLLWNTLMPLAVGGLVALRFAHLGYYQMLVPVCLIFYGLALVHGSKFTLGEVKYLGYMMLLAGLANLWWLDYSLFFWSLGFGVFHIFYGVIMWWKYERNVAKD